MDRMPLSTSFRIHAEWEKGGWDGNARDTLRTAVERRGKTLRVCGQEGVLCGRGVRVALIYATFQRRLKCIYGDDCL